MSKSVQNSVSACIGRIAHACLSGRVSARAIVGTILTSALFTVNANGADVSWGGIYRFEANMLKNPELSDAQSNKNYALHHLILTPKLIAADGLTIHSRLDLLNNADFGIESDGRVLSVAGDVIGSGPGRGIGGTANSGDSNVLSRTQKAGDLAVTALFATWTQEFGQLIVGRTPIQFGLGTAFNAGNGDFDHFIDTKDLVGYKVVLGNLFVLPMLGKVNEGVLGEEDDVNDYILHAQYDNPETELSLGAIYQIRVWTFAGNDTPEDFTSGTNTRVNGGKTSTAGIYSSQKLGEFTVAVEADLMTGDMGQTAAGLGVTVNSLGIAADVAWRPENAKFSGNLKAGFASGDDPGTSEVYEGFIFNRNYDVGLLMFNHPLGQCDFLRTSMVRPANACAPAPTGAAQVSRQIDTEAISNAIYIAPSAQFRANESLSYGGTLVYAMLNKEPIVNSSTSSNLGFEIDLNVTYKPYERLTWITEAGFLLPGDAWKAGTQNLDNKFAYGFVTKAAINF